MLAKPIYEALPYAYMFGGLGAITISQNQAQTFIACLLVLFGGLVYVWRSENRRTDIKLRRKGKIPKYFYELAPFAYGLVACLSLKYSQPAFAKASSLGLLLVAIYVLYCRANYRRHRSPHRAA
ncbi:hypothetical protein [Paraferrimonas sedimenticola]|uniref:Uncharacterized protein n=1 Tax=Paraferrimonas sedimenticola TaxID=375674 RepID=A0AA37VYT0_9GAMM|nr:hypothetical protein [Paraferrimonas sedimenticola]GLP97166.1 hypothetical protein GCM10007895_24730 [Paraferrimonas sedimenticola]